MENLKPTQNHEQRETPEDYVVKTFPTDNTNLDNARYPLTIIRRGKDGEDVKHDEGWNPIGMSVVCYTDHKKGIGPINLLMEVYKLVGADIKTEFVPLGDIQGLDKGYIEYLYGKSTEEMLEEGMEAAKRIWRQKHPVGSEIESLAPEVGSDSGAEASSGAEIPSNRPAAEDSSGHERPSAEKVGPVMGGVAVEAVEDIWRQKHLVNNEPESSATEMHLENSSDDPELERFDKRVRELMRPLETDVDGMPFREDCTCAKSNFEYLFDPNYVPSNNVEDAAVRNPKGLPVSEGSFNAAKGVIDNLVTNLSLMQIIDPERALDPRVIMNNIRSSHLTRCRLFEYLASRLDRLAIVNPGDLADRVLRNSGDNLKSPNYLEGGYYGGKMLSREYVVVLAIAMMDGSFDVGRQDKMVTHYRNGEGRSGMHRDSARTLLEYVGNSY